jgi:hypothetical protein
VWVDTQSVQPWCILPVVRHQFYSKWLVDILLFLVLAWMWDWYVKECVWRTLYTLHVTDNFEVFTAITCTIIFSKNTVNCLTHVAHCHGNFSFQWIFVPESVRNVYWGSVMLWLWKNSVYWWYDQRPLGILEIRFWAATYRRELYFGILCLKN